MGYIWVIYGLATVYVWITKAEVRNTRAFNSPLAACNSFLQHRKPVLHQIVKSGLIYGAVTRAMATR